MNFENLHEEMGPERSTSRFSGRSTDHTTLFEMALFRNGHICRAARFSHGALSTSG